MKTCLLVVTFVAVSIPAAACAGHASPPSNVGPLLLAGESTDADEAAESERIHQRIQQLRQTRRQRARYGTGFESRKALSEERADSSLDQDEQSHWLERTQRPRRLGRPDAGGARHGGR